MSARGTGKSSRGGSAKQAKVPAAVAARKKVGVSRKENGLVLVVDVDIAEPIPHRIDYGGTTFRCGDVGRYEHAIDEAARPRAGGDEDSRTLLAQARRHRLADPLGATRDQGPASIHFEPVAHPQSRLRAAAKSPPDGATV